MLQSNKYFATKREQMTMALLGTTLMLPSLKLQNTSCRINLTQCSNKDGLQFITIISHCC